VIWLAMLFVQVRARFGIAVHCLVLFIVQRLAVNLESSKK
jgi:hypothetical protein